MGKPPAPPEAVLIRLAREAADIRVADAARRAGVSIARWSQIENGSEIRHGTVTPVTGRAGTIARMAAEVGVSPERMAKEGRRPDAAEILREIIRQQADSRAVLAELPPAPEPSARRKYADDDDPVTAGYVREIHALLAEAMRKYGPHFAAEDAFTEAHEIETWADLDGKMPDPEDRIRLMARIRRRVAAELERPASNTGLARALISAGHGFP